MIDQIRIESAVPDDISDLTALDVWLTNSGRQEQIIRESIAQGTCWVARTDETPVAGFVTWNRSFFNRPFVWLLVVKSNYRRRGIARMLLTKVEQVCGDDIFVSTERINSGMRTLLEGMKYVNCGEIEYINPLGNPELFFYKRLNGTDESMAFPFDR